MNDLTRTITELNRIFDCLNERYFKSELELPIITIQRARSNNLGHFTLSQIWKNKETEETKYEININPINLDRESVSIVSTLLHEMCHLSNKMNEIKDAPNNIHNKKFKLSAENVDLIVTKGKQGWAYTEPSEKLITYINEEIKPDASCFKYFMNIPKIEKPDKPTNKRSFKYTCPKCGMEVKAKPDNKIVCGNCNVGLEMEEE